MLEFPCSSVARSGHLTKIYMIPLSGDQSPIPKVMLSQKLGNQLSFLSIESAPFWEIGIHVRLWICIYFLCVIIAVQTKPATVISAGPCVLPPVINGSLVEPRGAGPGTRVPHGSTLRYECNDGFQTGTTSTTCCHNGTWLTTPVCSPGLCQYRCDYDYDIIIVLQISQYAYDSKRSRRRLLNFIEFYSLLMI